jgi:hypothetical protein
MWGAEHVAMLAAFSLLAAWLAYNRRWEWLAVAAISQVPFWGGYMADAVASDPSPASINIILNICAAGAFATFAEWLQSKGRGGIVPIWLCVIFLIMASLDVVFLLKQFPSYFVAQEILHYLALITVGARTYVVRRSYFNRDLVHSSNTSKSEDLA